MLHDSVYEYNTFLIKCIVFKRLHISKCMRYIALHVVAKYSHGVEECPRLLR